MRSPTTAGRRALPEAEMLAYAQRIKERGLAFASRELFDRDPDTFWLSFDHSCADWRFGTEVKKTDRVLDVRCGMGGNALALCDLVDQIVAFDVSWIHAKIVQLRAAGEEKSNIRVFCGSFMNVPLAEGQFDLIILDDMLEWLGQSSKFPDPRDVQRWVIRECWRLLRSEGRIYLGARNRWALEHLTTPDHDGLMWTSFMPRFLARAYSRLRKGKDYRTYTYGKTGYEKLLREGGFTDVRVMMPYPVFRDHRRLIPFDNVACFRYAVLSLMDSSGWKRQLVRLISSVPGLLALYRHLFLSYSIYAVKTDAH